MEPQDPTNNEPALSGLEKIKEAAKNAIWQEPDPVMLLDPKRRFRLVKFDNIKPPTGSHYIVKNVIPKDGLIVIWGPPKCGKSFLVLDLMMCVATGQEYRGHKVRKGVVVYIALEGEFGLSGRIEAYRRAKLSDNTESVEFYLITTKLDLAADASALAEEIRAQLDGGCSCIVVDTLNRSLNGSESSDLDMGQWIRGADTLRIAFECSVIVVHHCGHESTRPRGHTSLLGAADAQIAVSRDASGVITLLVEHMKDGPSGTAFTSTLLVVDLGTNEDGDALSSCVIEAMDNPNDQKVPPQHRISDQNKIALDCLRRAIDDLGEIPPENDHIPSGHRAVTREQWRDYCYRGAISEDTAEAKRQAFNRTTKWLQRYGYVGAWNGWIWSSRKRDIA